MANTIHYDYGSLEGCSRSVYNAANALSTKGNNLTHAVTNDLGGFDSLLANWMGKYLNEFNATNINSLIRHANFFEKALGIAATDMKATEGAIASTFETGGTGQ